MLMLPLGYPWHSSKNASPFGPAVWSVIANIYVCTNFYIYMCEELYYIEERRHVVFSHEIQFLHFFLLIKIFYAENLYWLGKIGNFYKEIFF